MWCRVWSSILQGHVAVCDILNLCRYNCVFPWPVTNAVKFGFIFIVRCIMSRTLGKNCLVTAALLHRSHCCCHFCVVSSSSMCVCIYVCVYMYVCIYVCMYACIFVCMYVCMHACMYVSNYVCIYIYLYFNKHLLYCMLHYYGIILHALMVTFTY